MRVEIVTNKSLKKSFHSLGTITDPIPQDAICFIGFENEKAVVRCAILFNADTRLVTIGWFYSLPEITNANNLFSNIVEYSKQFDTTKIIGPMNGDSWHHYRFAEMNDNSPFLKEPINPEHYNQLWIDAGFSICETYETDITESKAAADSQKKFYDRALKKGYRFMTITQDNYQSLLPVLYELSIEIFKDNIHFTPITYEQFVQLYSSAKPIIKQNLSWIAFKDKKPVGFVFAYPDYIEAYESMKGSNSPLAKLKFLWNKRLANRICVKTLGVLPETRGSGLSAALTYLAYHNASEMGFKTALMCLMHSENDSRHFGGGNTTLYRKYHLYELSNEIH